jgi:hypothetical protein
MKGSIGLSFASIGHAAGTRPEKARVINSIIRFLCLSILCALLILAGITQTDVKVGLIAPSGEE